MRSLIFFVLIMFGGVAHSMPLDELYTLPNKWPAVLPKGTTLPVPLKRVPVGGLPGIALAIAGAYILEKGNDALESLRTQVGADNKTGFPTPPGWIDAEHPPSPTDISRVPDGYCVVGGSVGNASTYGTCNPNDIYQTPLAAASAYFPGTRNFAPCTGYVANVHTVDPYTFAFEARVHGGNCNDYLYATYTGHVQDHPGCQVGYALNSGSTQCVLVDSPPAQWPSDSVPTIAQSGGQFVPHPRDPDSANITGSQSTISTNGVNGDGEPVRIDYNAHADGSMDVRIRTQYNAPDCTTGVNDYKINFSKDGVVNNITNFNTYNIDQSTNAGPIASSSTGQSSPTINLPTDYNREATQQQIKSGIDTLHDDVVDVEAGVDILHDDAVDIQEGIGVLHNDLTAVPTAPEAVSLPTDDISAGGLLTWSSGLGDDATCPDDPSVTVLGHTIQFNWMPKVCATLGFFRPFVIGLGTFIAGCIVAGVRLSGGAVG